MSKKCEQDYDRCDNPECEHYRYEHEENGCIAYLHEECEYCSCKCDCEKFIKEKMKNE